MLTEIDAGGRARQWSHAQLDARALDFASALAAGPAAPFAVVCARAPSDLIAAGRAVLAAGIGYEPWQFNPDSGDWRGLARRARRFRPMEARPLLLLTPEVQGAFAPEERALFSGVLEVANGAGARAPGHPMSIPPDGQVYIETAGTTGDPKPVALSLCALDLRSKLDTSRRGAAGPHLCVLPVDTNLGCPALAGGGADLWLDPDEAAGAPLSILAAARAHNAQSLTLTPGHVTRLIAALVAAGTVSPVPLKRIEIGGAGPVNWVEAEALARALADNGAPVIDVVYSTLECGPLWCARADAGQPLPRDGRHCVFDQPEGAADTRVVDVEFQPVPAGAADLIQVQASEATADGYRNPDGSITPLLDASGRVRTGDTGALTPRGLIVTSPTGSELVVPRRVHSLSEIEARLQRIPGLQPESVAVLASGQSGLAVLFGMSQPDSSQARRIAAEVSAAVIGQTGVQPEVYHLRPDQVPLTPMLTPRRGHYRRLITNGVLRPVEAPAAGGLTGPQDIARHERLTRVAEVWASVLNLSVAPGEDADFFALGADSLNLTSMLDQLEEVFGQAIDIEAFFAASTVGGLADLLADQAAAAPVAGPEPVEGGDTVRRLAKFTSVWRGARPFADSLIRSANTDGTRPPLFWILQSEKSYIDLAAALGPDQPFHALRSAVGVVDHYTLTALEAIADRYLWEILSLTDGKPFYLGGNCQGAIVALVLARRLRQIRHAPRRLVMMEWFFDFGGYEGPTSFLTGKDSFVAELQLTAPSLQKLAELFPDSRNHAIPGSHGEFFRGHIIGGVAEGIRAGLSD